MQKIGNNIEILGAQHKKFNQMNDKTHGNKSQKVPFNLKGCIVLTITLTFLC
jgi:hypothetical protein